MLTYQISPVPRKLAPTNSRSPVQRSHAAKHGRAGSTRSGSLAPARRRDRTSPSRPLLLFSFEDDALGIPASGVGCETPDYRPLICLRQIYGG